MAQVDLATYFVISVWAFIAFAVLLFFFIIYFFPIFITKIKTFNKSLMLSFLQYYFSDYVAYVFSSSFVFEAMLERLNKLLKE